MLSGTTTERPCILIVEDDRDYSSYLVQLFTAHGFHACAAYDFEGAAALAADLAPDVITLDIQLDGRSGLFLFHRLRSLPHTRETPVIVVTGLSMNLPDIESLMKEFMETGDLVAPSAYVEKPVDGPELIRLALGLLREGD